MLFRSYLAIPAMAEAAAFLEAWITQKGANVERLGMLAWAKGCLADYPAAESLWQETYRLAQVIPAEALACLPFIAYTLVDCFSEAGEFTYAQDIARQAWNLCGARGALPPQGTFTNDSDWLLLWRQAKLDAREIAGVLLARHRSSDTATAQANALAIRSWVDDPALVSAAWMDWAQARISAGEWKMLEDYRFAMTRGLRSRGFWKEANQLAVNVWNALGEASTPEADKGRDPWDWERFNPVGAIEEKNWVAAQEIVLQEIEARGVSGAVGWAAIVSAGSGAPTPPAILQALREQGVASVDEYGMFGWYLVVRESAASKDMPGAFEALRKSLAYWSNSPYWITNLFEKDAYWGELRSHPEFRQAFDERRKRIGPIYGLLHYFPWW